ncbi:hypothetical protein [Kitasatospora sp. GP82]|uniref:hypothetical protein n=1 Tax=Kitasatospora sp. GP82 TaxID=3035089 RepID=UPI002477047C|nr:hypothetical protein [Kitasatospora sp. GP82]
MKVYLGAAPGVGKTYCMLDEALRRKARGTDVVVAALYADGSAALVEAGTMRPAADLTCPRSGGGSTRGPVRHRR